ncbi:S8 family peptidase [Haloarchaeobius sp. TZWWS8]|uniref:S8 family peptidase n=1 Tax=Haloarchaeobius sp. TZWWS8 TaxID=3446121 RepID=UPI003EBA226E
MERRFSRRALLRAATGAIATAGLAGVAVGDTPGTERVRVNVGFDGPRGRAAAVRAAITVHHEFAFDALTLTVPRAAIEGLARNPNVRYVEEDGTWQAIPRWPGAAAPPGGCTPWPECKNGGGDEPAPAETLPWGIDRVDAEVAHANGNTGAGADIAILDTGIDSDHPDLQANLGAGKSFYSCQEQGGGGKGKKPRETRCIETWDDDHDHGTHCAGIAGGVHNDLGVVGVAPGATLHAVKVLNKDGSGRWSVIAAGIEYVADQGWDVGSLSLGGSSGSQAVADACKYAVDNGVVLVAAAGNAGPCSDCVGYPAAYPEVVAVSSTESDDDLSYFSSTGPEVDIAAPGTSVYSTVKDGGYDWFSGTSMATPHVSGAAALLRAAGIAPIDVKGVLTGSAENVGLTDTEQGAGLLDVAAALGLDSSDDLN